MHIRYPRLYAKLKHYGFSPAKAIEIMIDAKRRDRYSLMIVKAVRWS